MEPKIKILVLCFVILTIFNCANGNRNTPTNLNEKYDSDPISLDIDSFYIIKKGIIYVKRSGSIVAIDSGDRFLYKDISYNINKDIDYDINAGLIRGFSGENTFLLNGCTVTRDKSTTSDAIFTKKFIDNKVEFDPICEYIGQDFHQLFLVKKIYNAELTILNESYVLVRYTSENLREKIDNNSMQEKKIIVQGNIQYEENIDLGDRSYSGYVIYVNSVE